MQIDYKTNTIENFKREDAAGKTYITGYANTKNNADSYGDIPTNYMDQPVYNFDKRFKANPICFVDHWSSAANIAGTFVDYREDDTGLWFKLLLRDVKTIHNPETKDAVQAFVDGFGRAISIGGRFFWGDDKNPKHLTKAIIHEISIVGLGADQQALTDVAMPKSKRSTALSGLPKTLALRERPWDKTSAEKRWREKSGSTEKPSNTYKNNFLYYNESNLNEFGNFKLPIGDVVNDKHVVIPRAIFAARAVLSGARGGIEIPNVAKKEIEKTINNYYIAMEMPVPFVSEKNVWTLPEILNLAKSDLAFVIKNNKMSGSSADYIASTVLSTPGKEQPHSEGDVVNVKEILNLIEKIKG